MLYLSFMGIYFDRRFFFWVTYQSRFLRVLIFLSSWNRETQKVHLVNVTALDCADDYIDSKIIKINVCDINDHAPWFDPGSLIMEMCPDAKVGDTVGTLS